MKTHFLLITGLAVSLIANHASLVDTTFNPGTGAGGGIVEQVLPLADGHILICGNFTSFNGKDRGYVARLNSDGSVDETFDAHPGYWVRHMEVQADGKIVIGGYFTTVDGVSRNLIARLNSNGSLDTSFDPGLGARDIIAGGVDGNIDPFVFWLAIQPDQKIIITGNFRNYNGASSTGIARLNPDGSRDASFNVGSGFDSWGRHIQILPNGQILVGGWFTIYNNRGYNRLVRINPDGSADQSYNPYFGDRTAIYSTVMQGDGKVIAMGHSLNYDGLFTREVERLNLDGSVDESFVGRANDKTETSVLQPDGKLIIAGSFSRVNDTPRTCLARFNPDGTLDDGFSANIDNFVWGTALQPDGKLLIAGGFYTVDGFARSGVARLETGIAAGGTTGGGGTPDTPPVLSVGSPGANTLTLTWSDNSSARSGYVVQRKDGTGAYLQAGTVSAGIFQFQAAGLAPNTSYTFRLKANNSDGTSIYSNESTGTTAAVSGGGSGSAVYVSADSVTKGTWKGVYGSDGYSVFGDNSSLPSYVTVTPIGKSDWTWQWSTQDPAAVQRANSTEGTDRLAACWYSASGYSIDLNFTDGQTHRTAIYFLDWDQMGRRETVQITDGSTGTILDSRTVTSFGGGIYYLWDLKGHLKLTITTTSGNGVASGIFFGASSGGTTGGGTSGGTTGGGVQTPAATPVITPTGGSFNGPIQVTLATSTAGATIRYTLDGTEPGSASTLYASPITISTSETLKAKAFASGYSASATASAAFLIATGGGSDGGGTGGTTGGIGGANAYSFVGSDATTLGSWIGSYGTEGYAINGTPASYPAYATVSTASKQDWVWNQTTTDTHALQTPDGSSRIASCWYGDTFTVDINLTDGKTHAVAMYFLDWDNSGRSETVDVLDGDTGANLQHTTVSNFVNGRYLVWNLKGHIKFQFTRLSGYNAVVNGLFFQAASTQL